MDTGVTNYFQDVLEKERKKKKITGVAVFALSHFKATASKYIITRTLFCLSLFISMSLLVSFL